MASYAFARRTLHLPHEEAGARVRDALPAEGFGIIAEIDVQKPMKAKLDVDFRPYVILGACNPPLAHGLLLPCNVIVYAEDDQHSIVEALDPETIIGLAGDATLNVAAGDAKERLERAMQTLEAVS
ncbi:MAG: DUF302 domain-containing protein [Dehalococcoidia bacterium]|nr:DUF302 domain-containing protein [Dehalococcoidia bacterium]